MSETIQELCSSLGLRLVHSSRDPSRTFREYSLHWTRSSGPLLDLIQVNIQSTVQAQIDDALDAFGWMLPVPRYGSTSAQTFESLTGLADSLTHAVAMSRLPPIHSPRYVEDASDTAVMLMAYHGLVEAAPFVPMARAVVTRPDDLAVALSMWLLKPEIVAQMSTEAFYDPRMLTEGRHRCEQEVSVHGVPCLELLYTTMKFTLARRVADAAARLPPILPGALHWATHCAMFRVPETTQEHVMAQVHQWHRETDFSEDFLLERAYIQNAVMETPKVYFNVL